MAGFDYDNYISPCKNICTTDVDNKFCIGCYRTVPEIKAWFRYTKEEKLAIMDELPEREKHGYPKGLI
jgi:uncharacterized protein